MPVLYRRTFFSLSGNVVPTSENGTELLVEFRYH
jgi:hypothetical protein